MGVTGNNSGVRVVVVLIVIAFMVVGLGWCDKADAQELPLTSVGIGTMMFGGDECGIESMLIAREFGNRKWMAGLVTHGTGKCRGEAIKANIGLLAVHQLHFRDRLSIGFGGALFEHGDIGIGKASILNDVTEPRTSDTLQLAAVILIRVHFPRNDLYLDFPLHFSSGGASRFNPGKNMIDFGVRF